MDEILSNHELQALTGYKSNRRIIAWLNRNHIPFLSSGNGKPLVNRQALAYLMGAPTESNPSKPIELDFNHKGFI